MPKTRTVNQIDTVEGSRLHSDDCLRWQRWGPISERTSVGHGPRGLQRIRHRIGTFRTIMRAAARIAGARTAFGIAGFGDDKLNWCVSLALWNGRNPIIKERLFGLTNEEGNHGEDVKDL